MCARVAGEGDHECCPREQGNARDRAAASCEKARKMKDAWKGVRQMRDQEQMEVRFECQHRRDCDVRVMGTMRQSAPRSQEQA